MIGEPLQYTNASRNDLSSYTYTPDEVSMISMGSAHEESDFFLVHIDNFSPYSLCLFLYICLNVCILHGVSTSRCNHFSQAFLDREGLETVEGEIYPKDMTAALTGIGSVSTLNFGGDAIQGIISLNVSSEYDVGASIAPRILIWASSISMILEYDVDGDWEVIWSEDIKAHGPYLSLSTTYYTHSSRRNCSSSGGGSGGGDVLTSSLDSIGALRFASFSYDKAAQQSFIAKMPDESSAGMLRSMCLASGIISSSGARADIPFLLLGSRYCVGPF